MLPNQSTCLFTKNTIQIGNNSIPKEQLIYGIHYIAWLDSQHSETLDVLTAYVYTYLIVLADPVNKTDHLLNYSRAHLCLHIEQDFEHKHIHSITYIYTVKHIITVKHGNTDTEQLKIHTLLVIKLCLTRTYWKWLIAFF